MAQTKMVKSKKAQYVVVHVLVAVDVSTPPGRLRLALLQALARTEKAVSRRVGCSRNVEPVLRRVGRPRKLVNVEEIKRLHAKGLGKTAIARRLGVDEHLVRARLQELGL